MGAGRHGILAGVAGGSARYGLTSGRHFRLPLGKAGCLLEAGNQRLWRVDLAGLGAGNCAPLNLI